MPRVQRSEPAQRRSIAGARGIQQRTCLLALVLEIEAQRLLRLFVELNKSGTSVVIATHDIGLMDQYDAKRLVLHDGRLHIYD